MAYLWAGSKPAAEQGCPAPDLVYTGRFDPLRPVPRCVSTWTPATFRV